MRGDAALREEVESLLAHKEAQASSSPPPWKWWPGLARTIRKAPCRGEGEERWAKRFPTTASWRSSAEVAWAWSIRPRTLQLGRFVALKFLPEELCQDRQALERFRREARAASALNHPNICTVYDIDEQEGQPFIVMEYLEGQTLKHRIKASPLKVPRAAGAGDPDCRCAGGRAPEGHRSSRHQASEHFRDGTRAGQDSGLRAGEAGAAQTGAGGCRPGPGDTQTPRQEESLTSTGMAVGTVEYMSPEQVRAEELDARTDLFSFGVVLYEMATGRRASRALAGHHLRRHPTRRHVPVRLNPECPAELERIINKALEKSRESRYQSASDMRAELQRLKRDLESTPRGCGAAVPGTRSESRRDADGTEAAGECTGNLIGDGSPRPSHRAVRLPLVASVPPELKGGVTDWPTENPLNLGAVSPDGKYLGYGDQNGSHLELIQTGEVRDIPQPEGQALDLDNWWPNARFPDSTKFIASGWVSGQSGSSWVISVVGGPPRKLRDDADKLVRLARRHADSLRN